MKIVVFGASGQVGASVVREALAEGHEVRAFVREKSRSAVPPGATVVAGELDDEQALRSAIEGADAVVSALGQRQNVEGQANVFADAQRRITRIMREEGVKRLVMIGGAALVTPGEHPNFGRRAVLALMKLVAKHVLEAKRREMDVVISSGVDWIIVRPGRIMPGAPTGKVRASLDKLPNIKVSAGDVARFMLEATESDTWLKKAPLIG